jgi:hypothetical protein
MGFYRRYSLLIGLFTLVLVIVLLLSTPDFVFSTGVTFIDSELYRSSGDEAYVRTKMDFGSSEDVSAYPTEIGDWSGYDYDVTEIKETLGGDVILLRGYSRPGVYQPLFFLIMQAETESSFHPPPVCYPALGYHIQEEGKEQVVVTDTSWTEADSSLTVPLKKLVVFKESGGEVTDRRVVLYCYVKGNQLASDTITMIRVEALAPVEGSYDGILNVEKDFAALTIPYMFEPNEEEKWSPLAVRLAESGIGGYFAIALLLFVPLAIMLYPRTRRGEAPPPNPSPGNEA